MTRYKGLLIGIAASAGIILVISTMLGLFSGEPRFYRNFNIPSESMSPTLRPGDIISANILHYNSHQPAYGDVAIFASPSNQSAMFVMRIVGLPDDQIMMQDGRLVINGAMLPSTPIPAENLDTNLRGSEAEWFQEELPNGKKHSVLNITDNSMGDNTRAFSVPEGHIFVLGDNRDNSNDSRFNQVGFVPVENLRGRASTVLWPMSRFGLNIHEQAEQ